MKNWDDLRYLLAVQRGRSLSRAAGLLGVNDTTISRRIKHLESMLGHPLIHRVPDGTIELTTAGEAVAALSEQAEHHIELIEESLGSEGGLCQGIVRVTSVPVVINHLLTPKIGALLRANPKLDIELIAESRDLSLSRREADIALRLARPTVGGSQIKIRKLAELPCSVFLSRKITARQISTLPWIAYDDSLAHIPPEKWIRSTSAKRGEPVSNIRVHDAETALQAVLAGLGKTVLPDFIAENDNRLKRLTVDAVIPPPARELWILTHAGQAHLRRIRAVSTWIETALHEH